MVGVRRAVLVAVASPVIASAVLAGSAAPANASEPTIGGGGVKTGDVARITGNGGTALGVHRLARLILHGKQVARGKGPISYSFSTHSLPNGSYQASLQTATAGLIWTTREKTTVRLRSAPYTPSHVSVHRSGHTVTLHWARGVEPDLTSYRVLSTADSLSTKRSESTACGSSLCSATLHLPSGGSGAYGFAVRAYRSDGSGGTIASGTSNTHYVRLPAPRTRSTPLRRTPNGRAGAPGVTNSPLASPLASPTGGGYLPPGLGSPTLPQSTGSPLKLPNVGPRGFNYPTPDQPRVAPPPKSSNGRQMAQPSSAMTPVSPYGVGAAAALGGVLVIAHLLARWRLRIAARALEKAGMRTAARNGHAWEAASAWSKSAARRLKRVYHRERRRH